MLREMMLYLSVHVRVSAESLQRSSFCIVSPIHTQQGKAAFNLSSLSHTYTHTHRISLPERMTTDFQLTCHAYNNPRMCITPCLMLRVLPLGDKSNNVVELVKLDEHGNTLSIGSVQCTNISNGTLDKFGVHVYGANARRGEECMYLLSTEILEELRATLLILNDQVTPSVVSMNENSIQWKRLFAIYELDKAFHKLMMQETARCTITKKRYATFLHETSSEQEQHTTTS